MDLQHLAHEVIERVAPTAPPAGTTWILLALGTAVLAVTVPLPWRVLRPAVTIVHELGHALVGVATGRRFTGFVVSADMSGHAVTVGKRRGAARLLTTWAGYPAPAVTGAALIQVAVAGWAGAALGATVLALLIALFFTRSLHTVAAVLLSAVVAAAVWWFSGPAGAAFMTLLLVLAASSAWAVLAIGGPVSSWGPP